MVLVCKHRLDRGINTPSQVHNLACMQAGRLQIDLLGIDRSEGDGIEVTRDERKSLFWECVFDIEMADGLMVFGRVMLAGIVGPVGSASTPQIQELMLGVATL